MTRKLKMLPIIKSVMQVVTTTIIVATEQTLGVDENDGTMQMMMMMARMI